MLQRLFKDIVILVLLVITVGAVIAGCFHDKTPVLPAGYAMMPDGEIYKVVDGELLPLFYKTHDGYYHLVKP